MTAKIQKITYQGTKLHFEMVYFLNSILGNFLYQLIGKRELQNFKNKTPTIELHALMPVNLFVDISMTYMYWS